MRDMTLKLPLLIEKLFGRYFQVRSLVRQYSATRKHLFLYPHGDRSSLRKPKKGQISTLITATTSLDLPKSVLTDH